VRWRQKYKQFLLKIVREKATPEYIARGWAIGMFYGCLIPFGLQLACSIPTAFLLKGSKIGATFGTLLTNHVTIFFIYPVQCWVGIRCMGKHLSYAEIENAFSSVLREQSWASLFALGRDLAAGFFIGGAILTAIMTPITYFFVLNLVRQYRALRSSRRTFFSKQETKVGKEKADGC